MYSLTEAAHSSSALLPRALLGDERLARLVERGDRRAFAAIYERHHEQLYRYCLSIVGEREDAYDALQSTLTNALVALGEGTRNAPVRPWLFRIAHDEAVTLARRRATVGRPPRSAERLAPSAEDEAAERASLALLMADLQALPTRQRNALLMREVSGLSHEEIGLALGISAATVKGAVFRARCALAESREGRGVACETVRRAVSDNEASALRRRYVSAHLRDCNGCAEFAAAIPARRRNWHVLTAPLAPLASAGLLAHIIGAGSAQSATGAGGALMGAGGQAFAASLAAKTALGIVIAASAAATLHGVSKGDGQSKATPTVVNHRSVGTPHRRAAATRARASSPGHARVAIRGRGRPRSELASPRAGSPTTAPDASVGSRHSPASIAAGDRPRSADRIGDVGGRANRATVSHRPAAAPAKHVKPLDGPSGPPRPRPQVAHDTTGESNRAGHGAGSGGQPGEVRQAGGPGGPSVEGRQGGGQIARPTETEAARPPAAGGPPEEKGKNGGETPAAAGGESSPAAAGASTD
ncbi:MAG TPA: sigma-70 family RNA polymerase sigma factor [Solirubrobacteraceae bacterium]|nr:sigma-70 family RNA polymerase sigma factor [Solirubrobacteraceae bacterium]